MADLRPFPGIRYSPSLVGDLGAVVAPPYDVIPEADLAGYRARSPHNVVRLIRPGDDYAGAAATLDEWAREGVLLEDPVPALYLHEVDFEGATRRDLIGAVRLQDYADGVVLPHELTHRGPKEDRLALLRATATSLEPLWFLYEGAGSPIGGLLAEAAMPAPTLAFAGPDAQHRFWVLTDRDLLGTLRTAFAFETLLIADGHHRYETALAYAGEVSGARDASSRFTLALLTAMDDPGLRVLPTHRVMKAGIKVTGGEASASLDEVVAAIRGRVAAGHYRVGSFEVLPLEGEVAVLELHRQVIDNILGRRSAEEALLYTRDAPEAVRWVDEGRGVAAFLLDAPPLRQVLKLAREGTALPQKSTYFHPKPPSGMVFMGLDPNLQL